MRRRLVRRLALAATALAVVALVGLVLLAQRTRAELLPLPDHLQPVLDEVEAVQVLDRTGTPLSVSYRNHFNVHDRVSYHEVPELLRDAFLLAEDKRFFDHRGGDWVARFTAVWQNLIAGRKVRGASTISEQVVRILHPRPRTLWSRWLESVEARRLERRFDKVQILEFYLNQVPYASNRRGVVQAAATYFGRDLDTLSPKEMLALAVLVRSPSRLDLLRGTEEIEQPLLLLAERLRAAGKLDEAELGEIVAEPLHIVPARLEIDAAHFVRFVSQQPHPATRAGGGRTAATVSTTLDGSLQSRVQAVLDQRLEALAHRDVSDGAVLVVDHRNNEILAWVNGGGFSDRDGGQIDKVLVPRQPGSTLKPFVYGLALERGWTAATLVEDAPLADPVGHGRHQFKNYSRVFYGPLRLREALGNSLNTPAVRAARFVGAQDLLDRLHAAGFETLDQHPDFYGDGLALGNGEVRLYDLVAAYAALARGGRWLPLRHLQDGEGELGRERILFSPEISSILAHILSDSEARSLEFGRHSLLELPVQTAVKTGTSNDYHDAWAVGFSYRYTVGVWMGNVDRRPMREVSGSVGPALVLRAVFAELHRDRPSEPLYLSRSLEQVQICRDSGLLATAACPLTDEWFQPGHAPRERCYLHGAPHSPSFTAQGPTVLARLESPTPGLHLARDPRIPDELEAFPFRIESPVPPLRVEWILDGAVAAVTTGPEHLWPLVSGSHSLQARVWVEEDGEPVETQSVGFLVK